MRHGLAAALIINHAICADDSASIFNPLTVSANRDNNEQKSKLRLVKERLDTLFSGEVAEAVIFPPNPPSSSSSTTTTTSSRESSYLSAESIVGSDDVPTLSYMRGIESPYYVCSTTTAATATTATITTIIFSITATPLYY